MNDKYIQKILNEIIDVVSQIENRTVEKPSDRYVNTPIKQQITEIKAKIRML